MIITSSFLLSSDPSFLVIDLLRQRLGWLWLAFTFDTLANDFKLLKFASRLTFLLYHANHRSLFAKNLVLNRLHDFDFV
jgi:hypothetical protein